MKLKKVIIPYLLIFISVFGCNEDESEEITPAVVITTADFAVTVDEEPSKGQVLGQVSGTASSGTVTFSIVSQDPENAMSIDSSTGELKVNEVAAFDYETRTTVIGLVKVASEGASKEAKVTITITDVPVVVTTENFTVSVDENPVAGQSLGKLTGAASEGSVAFKISKQDVSDALTIDAATGELKVKDASLFDFETRTKLQATVEVTGGSDMKESNVTITINNVTEITVEDFTASLNENPDNEQSIGTIVSTTDTGSLTFSISSQSPADALAIDASTGALTVNDKSLFDYETYPSITAVVSVASGEASKQANVTLTLQDIAGTWQTVGAAGFSAGVASNQSLVIYDGVPYVAYTDNGNASKATVMKFNGTSWVNVGQVGFSASSANYISLAIDNGIPYVAFQDGGNSNKATVMKFDGSNWVNVGSAGFSDGAVFETNLVLDNGVPYVSYGNVNNSDKATVMKFNGTSWVDVGLPGFSAGAISFSSLAVDNGVPYLAYEDASVHKTTVMKFDGTNWVNVGDAGFSADQAFHQSLVIDNGVPYVAYDDAGNGNRTTVMKFDGSNWVNVGNAGLSTGGSSYQSLVVYNGIPFVAYQDYDNSDKATVMKFNGTDWVNVGDVGFSAAEANFLSLAVDKGVPYLAFRDANNGLYSTTVMKIVEESVEL